MAHIHDKIDFTVEVFIVCAGKVLLRKHDKYGIWLSVGGHIELDEDPVQAAHREVKEEVGLDITLVDTHQKFHSVEDTFTDITPPIGLNRHLAAPGHEHVTFVYFATSTTQEVVPEHPSDEWRWVSRQDLAAMDLKPNIRAYAEGALEMLG